MDDRLPAGVAAGHPATAQAGLDLLAAGGTSADAAAGAILASCVAETLLTGLGGGGFAIHWSVEQAAATCLDFFVTVPGLAATWDPAPMVDVEMIFGEAPLYYHVGPATVGVPGVPAGVGALHRRFGRLPWPEVVAPAIALARAGVALTAAHADVLEMTRAAMTRLDGSTVFAPGGSLLRSGDVPEHPGLDTALEVLAADGPQDFYTGPVGRQIADLLGGRGAVLTSVDLAAYRVLVAQPRTVPFAGTRLMSRHDHGDLLGALARLPADLDRRDPAQRVVAYADALADPVDADGHTTNICVADRWGNVTVATTSLGLGSGDWLPGLGIHFNSMLGEPDLALPGRRPGDRVASNMVPTVAVDARGAPVLAAGAAGGTRIRSSLVQAVGGVLAEGLTPQQAVDRARVHPAGDLVHVEGGAPPGAAAALAAAGWQVRAWGDRHYYFGGVSMIGLRGGAADPRRDGRWLPLDGSDR